MKKQTYYLIDYTTYHAGHVTMAYEGFPEIREAVVNIFHTNGWQDYGRVDLRSVRDCLGYLLDRHGAFNVKWRKSTSHKKFMEYRYGKRKRNL